MLLAAISAGQIHAQITVSGVANRNYNSYANSATFTVTLQTGYAGMAWLNDAPVPIGTAVTITRADYYELFVLATNQTTQTVASNLTQFIVYPSERGNTERGLPPLPLYPPIPSAPQEYAGANLRIMCPDRYPAGMAPPVVIWVVDDTGRAVRVNGTVQITGSASIPIKRGVGSGFLTPGQGGPMTYTFTIANLTTNKTVEYETSVSWTPVGGTLNGTISWPDNARIAITNHVNLTAGSSLTIGAGAIVRINPVISFTNNGQITINGLWERPTVFTPITTNQPWGGFVQHANNTAFNATGTIFTGAGGYTGYWFGGHGHDPSYSGITSHRAEQALISMSGANNNLTLEDCAAIWLPGQFGHAQGGSGRSYRITLNRFLMQRCTTGGEYTGAQFTVNDSAFIECPDISTNFADGDNDGLYIVDSPLGPHGFTNTLFGWTKDDGVDSGGDGTATLNYQNCWFEAIHHEANSLSDSQSGGPDKSVAHYDGVFINCGQALEAGYGGPTGRLERCYVVDCMTGARYGDNYNWAYSGRMIASNSILLHNHRDVWGMNFQDWTYRTDHMDIRGNYLTRPDPRWPENQVWNPEIHGALLGSFHSTPQAAPPGVGFAVWTNRFRLTDITNGVPVRLSVFRPRAVAARFTILGDGQPVTNGVVTFEAGRMLQFIQPTTLNPLDYATLTVQLTEGLDAEITGISEVTYSVILPQMSLTAGAGPHSLANFSNGVTVGLNEPALAGTTVNFSITGNRVGATNGTLSFGTGALSAVLQAPTVPVDENDFIWVSLSNPVKATLSGPAQAVWVRMPQRPPLTNTLLIARGSNTVWHYYGQVAAPPADWKALSFDHSGWASGGAQLGYSNGEERDETTLLPNVGAITTYFRRAFVVEEPAAYTNLTLWLLRDDGGVVYLNGQEIFRSPNLPTGTITHTTTTLSGQNGENTVDTATVPASGLVRGTNVVAVEIHQQSSTSSDLSFDFELWGVPAPRVPEPVPLYYGVVSGGLVLGWGDGEFQLLQATNIMGPWVTNSAPGWFAPRATNSQGYFRLIRP